MVNTICKLRLIDESSFDVDNHTAIESIILKTDQNNETLGYVVNCNNGFTIFVPYHAVLFITFKTD